MLPPMSEPSAEPPFDPDLVLARIRLQEEELHELDAFIVWAHARNPEGPRLRQLRSYVPVSDPLALDFLAVGLEEACLAFPKPIDALRIVARDLMRRAVAGELEPETLAGDIDNLVAGSGVPHDEVSRVGELWNFCVYRRYLRGAGDVGDGGWYDEICGDILAEAEYHLGMRDRPPPSFGDEDYDERRAEERARRAAAAAPAQPPMPREPVFPPPPAAAPSDADLAPALGRDDSAAEEYYALGLAYENGTGVARDPAKAVAWYRRAANFGHPAALNNLAYLYDRGEGVARDKAKAIECWLAAAERNDGRAQCWIGYAYEMGEGLPKDLGQALAWYRRAAENGSGAAHANLGNVYRIGEWIPRDLDLAVHHYRVAADLGEPRGMYQLGAMHQRGEGLPQDFERAADWLRRAYDALARQRR